MAYAIIKTGGKQYRVSEGDTVDVEHLALEPESGATLTEVLFYSDGSSAQIGTPFLEGAEVEVTVVKQFRAPKVTAFKYRRRKGYHRTKGHRRWMTRLEVRSIRVG
ncbi:MAG TPA: 50S ribosomal protein L21 [Verrucomicrobiales bacterium]|nr:50S ribosomal protein L21 [Verrucomicrobiales bacterium]